MESAPAIFPSVFAGDVLKKATDFHKLVLYAASLKKLLIISESFQVDFLKSCVFSMSSTNRDSLASFLMCIPLVSFSCPIVPASVLSTVLKRSGANGYSCLVPDFNNIPSCLSPFRMMFLWVSLI